MPSAGASNPPPTAERRPLAELTLKRRAVWDSRDEVRRSWSRPGHPFGAWTRTALELYLEEGFRERRDGQIELKCPVEIEAAVFDQSNSLDLLGAARKVEIPALFLWASGGNFPRAAYEEVVGQMPNGRIEDIDTGHLVPMEAPELLSERLLAFGPID